MNTRARGRRRYLEIKGYEVLEDSWSHGRDSIDFIATDEEGTLVFIAFRMSDNEGEEILEEKPDRKAFERLAAAYLAGNDVDPVEVRFDIVSMLVIGGSRALIRHHINALSPLG